MSFILSMSGVIVGRSELETRDVGRRVASGVFRPGLGYDLVEPVFSLHDHGSTDSQALARYRKAKAALRLELNDSSGSAVRFRDLHIRRDGDTDRSSLVLEVETDDTAIWTTSKGI